MACKDDRLNNLDEKDFARHTIIEQAQKSYDDPRSEKHNLKRIPDYLRPSGYFQGQSNLHAWNVTGCYYNAQTKVVFNDPQDTQTLYDEDNLLNKRKNYYTQIPPIDYQN